MGVLVPGSPASSQDLFEAFKQGMRELGYTEGRHVVFERRFGEGKPERLSDLAAELVRMKVDVILTSTDQGIAAVKQQTQTIPIVMTNSTIRRRPDSSRAWRALADISPAQRCSRSSAGAIGA